MRSDSAAYEQDNLDHWDSQGWRFAVSASMSPQLKSRGSQCPMSPGRLMEEKRGVIREWTEVDYVPSRKT